MDKQSRKQNENVTRIMQGYFVWLDVLNVLSILAVLALHHNGMVHTWRKGLAWKESLVVECLFYWAVPVFLMISGATLMEYRKRYSTVVFFRRRILRTLIPWILWSGIMLLWKRGTGQLDLTGSSVKTLLDLFLNYRIESSYYFFGELFACYLAIPVFSVLAVGGYRKELWYAAGINFLFLSCLPLVRAMTGISWSLNVPIAGSLILYPLLGYLLSTCTLPRAGRIGVCLAGAGGALFRFGYTYLRSMAAGKTDTSIKGYIYFHAVFLSAAVFLLVKSIPWERLLSQRKQRALRFLAGQSFGIYLLHKIVMYYLRAWTGLSDTRLLWRTVMIPVTYGVSLGLVVLLKKIPGLGKIICG